MNKKRTKEEIVYNFLSVIDLKDNFMTIIIRKANLSYPLFSWYETIIIKNGLAEKIHAYKKYNKKQRYKYHITPKGVAYLRNYEQYQSFGMVWK